VSDVEAAISEDSLAQLEAYIGSAEVAGMVELFGANLHDITEPAVASMKPSEIGKAAHSLISLAGYFGCDELAACSRDLLDAVHSSAGDLEGPFATTLAAAERAKAALERRYPSQA
jgi:hypothetical protein